MASTAWNTTLYLTLYNCTQFNKNVHSECRNAYNITIFHSNVRKPHLRLYTRKNYMSLECYCYHLSFLQTENIAVVLVITCHLFSLSFLSLPFQTPHVSLPLFWVTLMCIAAILFTAVFCIDYGGILTQAGRIFFPLVLYWRYHNCVMNKRVWTRDMKNRQHQPSHSPPFQPLTIQNQCEMISFHPTLEHVYQICTACNLGRN